MANLLVTGHTGFVGRTLLRRGESIAARHGWHVRVLPDGTDIRDPDLASCLRGNVPGAVLHLAALTNVAESFREPEQTFDVNFGGTRNLLKALRQCRFGGRFVYVSSGDCYGAIEEGGLPVREHHPLRPRSPYAVSKVAAEALCYQWSQTEHLDIVIARPFNHIGPGQESRFVIAAFAEQIARIAARRAAPVIHVGNLDVTRDFTDVQDVVDAYFALLKRGRTGEIYNVGSGREVKLTEVLATMLADAGVTAEIVADPARMRAAEQRRVVADVTKIGRDTGWQAGTPLASTLHEILAFWEQQVRDG